jgi:outer membrane protein assembly factor BamB
MKQTAIMALLGATTLAPALGCGGVREASPEVPVWKNRAGWVLKLEYQKDLMAPSRSVGEPYERTEPEIDPKGRRVFVGSSDGGLYALNAPDGEILWRFETLSFVQGAPLYDAEEDVLYFGSDDGALYKVHAAGGELIWRLSTQAEVSRRPILSSGLVYFANANDTLIAADAKTGEIRWAQHRTPAMGMEIAGYSGPLLHGGMVYMGFSDGTATAFDAVTGDERWQPVSLAAEAEEIIGDIPKYLDVDTTPEAIRTDAGAAIVFGSYVGGVYALDPRVGTLIWSNPNVYGVSDVFLWTQPAHKHKGVLRPARELLLVSTGTTGMWALDPKDGARVWQRKLPSGAVSQPVASSGAILINSSQLGTYLLSPIDGSLIDGIHFETGIAGTPAAFGRHAYVMTNAGTLLAFSIAVPDAHIETPASYHTPLEGF